MITRLLGVLLLATMAFPRDGHAPPYSISQEMLTGSIILHIVSRDELAQNCSPTATACSKKWSHPPCEIWVPATDIEATPGLLEAHFDDDDITSDLAHEILHCTIGNWHPTPVITG